MSISGTKTIEIRNSTGHVLYNRVISPNAPTINVTTPNGGEVFKIGDTCPISWNASDLDGDPLKFWIGYSDDAGQTWAPLACNITGSSYTWNTTGFAEGAYLVKVTATDGVNTVADETDTAFNLSIIVGVHDVCLLDVSMNKTAVGRTYSTNITVTVENLGNFTETCNVTLYADINATILGDEIAIGNQTVPALANGTSVTLVFKWTTGDVNWGNYTISAEVTPVLSEENIDDNTLAAETEVCVTIPGDVNADRSVNIFDIVKIAGAYGTHEGQPKYNANCDIDNDGDVDIFDLVIAAGNYGQNL